MAEYILEAVDIEYKYPGGTVALGGLSMSVEKGGKAAVLGPNGAGKTTLFLHFNGILRPSRGRVRFAGRDVRYDQASLMELRKNVGIVFQDPDTQLFSSSVLQEVSFGPMNMGLPRDEVLRRVQGALEATGIIDLKHRPTHFLSDGQKKRVAIADVLAMDPPVIIIDEPTACLDPRCRRHVVDLLDAANREGKTVIMSTHDVDLAYSWADRVFVVMDGALAGEGRPEDVFQDGELLERAGLDRPWLVEIYGEIKKKGWLAAGSPPPRTKEQLYDIIPDGRRASK